MKRLYPIMTLLALTALLLPARTARAVSWWDTAWLYRKQVTINNTGIDENLTNFPMLVKLDSTRINYGQMKAAGADLRFTDSTNTVSYAYEIESWDATGISWVWVNIPTITASTNTTLYMYWGNSAASDAQNVTGTWNSNYVMVQHMYDNPDTSHVRDSTGVNNGTKKGAGEPVEVNAQIYKGQTFDATDDYIGFGSNSSLNLTTTQTIEMYCNITSLAPTQGLLTTNDAGSAKSQSYTWWIIGGVLRFFRGDGTSYDSVTMSPNPPTGTLSYLASVDDGTNMTFYLNGSLQSVPAAKTIVPKALDRQLAAGRISLQGAAGSWYPFGGSMDEIRISKVARSANWIKAQNLSMTDSYVTYGTQEGKPSISNFVASLSGGDINLNWTPGTYSTSTNIIRNTDHYPQNISDGTVIYSGNGDSYVDVGAGTNSITYFYAAYCSSAWGNSGLVLASAGQGASATSTSTTFGNPVDTAWSIPLIMFVFLAFWRRDIYLYLITSPLCVGYGLRWYTAYHHPAGFVFSLALMGIGAYCLERAIENLIALRAKV